MSGSCASFVRLQKRNTALSGAQSFSKILPSKVAVIASTITSVMDVIVSDGADWSADEVLGSAQ